MTLDDFQRQIDWVANLDGDEKQRAGSVVAWQCIAKTLNELVIRFNEINLAPVKSNATRYREVHLKKLIIGMLFEMDSCLDYWARLLRDDNLLTQDIKDKKAQFKTETKKVGLDVLKTIRNGIAFHLTDYLSDPDAVVETYTKADAITIESLNRVYKAAMDCGYAMHHAIMESITK